MLYKIRIINKSGIFVLIFSINIATASCSFYFSTSFFSTKNEYIFLSFFSCLKTIIMTTAMTIITVLLVLLLPFVNCCRRLFSSFYFFYTASLFTFFTFYLTLALAAVFTGQLHIRGNLNFQQCRQCTVKLEKNTDKKNKK